MARKNNSNSLSFLSFQKPNRHVNKQKLAWITINFSKFIHKLSKLLNGHATGNWLNLLLMFYNNKWSKMQHLNDFRAWN